MVALPRAMAAVWWQQQRGPGEMAAAARRGGSGSVVLERWQRRRGVVATAGETGKRLAGAMRAARRCGEGQQACLDSMRAEERSWESLWSRVWRLERERGDEEDR
ncbi:hypothetical protein VitviT2T_016789 [Vitis vinifera]|uniref:Uncharacterized protein n=1 Tax=Vitis vinifera TaxID=29760 RepID=A0ABY9CT39_VITVI|nr:hypothetical protein VitviT2T_016789 [Vitis vinifera]